MNKSIYHSHTIYNYFKIKIKKGFYTVGALKTNRVIYPCGIKQKISEFALHIHKEDRDVSPVTVGSRQFYMYR